MLRAMLVVMVCGMAGAQEMKVPKVVPVPPLPAGPAARRTAPEPVSPAAQTIEDTKTHLEFRLPAGWNLSRKDGEVSVFRLDARTAPRNSQLREVASLAFNPYPLSTFSGEMFYVSVTPRISAAACEAQATSKPETALPAEVVGDVKFARGKDEHGHICTEARVVTYTAMRGNSCLRFDLAINSFCGGDVSGAEDLTEAQLGALFKRLEDVLQTVKFTGK